MAQSFNDQDYLDTNMLNDFDDENDLKTKNEPSYSKKGHSQHKSDNLYDFDPDQDNKEELDDLFNDIMDSRQSQNSPLRINKGMAVNNINDDPL